MLVPWIAACTTTSAPEQDPLEPDPLVVERTSTPPVSGGGLARVGDRVVVVDVDGSRLLGVDPERREVTSQLVLEPSDLPGRVVEGPQGRGYVALRGTGEVASFEVEPLALRWRRRVCAAPTGLAWDPERELLLVACASGQLVTLDAAGETVDRTFVEADLRDVVVEGGRIWATTFRQARVLRLGEDGEILGRYRIPDRTFDRDSGRAQASVAWALVAAPEGGVALLHQWRRLGEIVVDGETGSSEYGSSPDTCSTVVLAGVTGVGADGGVTSLGAVAAATLAVDLAAGLEGWWLAVAGAPVGVQSLPFGVASPTDCLQLGGPFAGPDHTHAVLATDDGSVWALGRQPLELVVDGEAVHLPDTEDLVPDAGFVLFHQATPAGIACASCHPEAGDDGQVWSFADLGQRRTQGLRTALGRTAPYHWDGEFGGLTDLMDDVLVGRMGAEPVDDLEVAQLVLWLDGLAPQRAAEAPDPELVDQGRALFAVAECASCHQAPEWTDDRSHDVGTDGLFQTPSLLGVSARPPWMHDGCAATLRGRFDEACGGTRHGATAGLEDGDVDALVAFLETL